MPLRAGSPKFAPSVKVIKNEKEHLGSLHSEKIVNALSTFIPRLDRVTMVFTAGCKRRCSAKFSPHYDDEPGVR